METSQNPVPEVTENQESSTENVSCETSSRLSISFDANFNDIFDGLDATDTADGTNKKTRKLYLVLSLVMLVEIVAFAATGNGFIFVLAILMGAMAILIKKKSQRFNRQIAKEFADEGTQNVIFGEETLALNEKNIPYEEINHFYNLKRCFSIIYQQNHVYIIPKSILDDEQKEQILTIVDEMIPEAYEDKTHK